MLYLEMNRSGIETGSPWDFKKSVWSPAKKTDGGTWPYWSKILQIKTGDIILHLHGQASNANFVGFSIAASDGYETRERPPSPKQWDYADSFYRAEIKDFVALEDPINLTDLFAVRHAELEDYFEWNKSRGTSKANLFYVKKAVGLQCQNGAYLSDVDDKLMSALFGKDGKSIVTDEGSTVVSVRTGTRIGAVRQRIGQKEFSDNIKDLYSNKCCVPHCNINDRRFLVGAHIDRWSDNEELRGHLGNGLCLCLMHDKAFEIGLFTLDKDMRVFVNPLENSKSLTMKDLLLSNGQKIIETKVDILPEALEKHRKRVKISLN